ncbi:hypothetical protein EJ486_11065, partial [Acinetobacter baumannii]
FLCRLLHLKIILLKKPLRTALCNKAILYIKYLLIVYLYSISISLIRCVVWLNYLIIRFL